MTVRAIVLNYNSADCTLRCVGSLLEQLSAPSHVIVVDNGSESRDFRQLRLSLPASVTLIRNEKNLGYAAGNNQAIGVLDGIPAADAYLIVNNDVTLTKPNTIDALTKALITTPKAVAISPLVHTLSNNLPVRMQIQVRQLVKSGWLLLFHSPLLRRLPGIYQRHNQFIYADLTPYKRVIYEVDTINGACFLVQAPFFERIGGFDENTFLYLEELILGVVIRRSGYCCLLHGDAVIDHEQGSSSKQLTTTQRFRHFLHSETHLLTHYYGFPKVAMASIRQFRWAEFYLKQVYSRLVKLRNRL